MKAAYPIILTPGKKFIVVYIPDFNINTQGTDYLNAIEMARDAIGLMGIDMEDCKERIPMPTTITNIKKENESDIVVLVDVDFTEYRQKNDNKTVRRNVTLPYWLDIRAKESGLNVSSILQSALKKELRINS